MLQRIRRFLALATFLLLVPTSPTATSAQAVTLAEARSRTIPVVFQFERQITEDVGRDGIGGITAAAFVGNEVFWIKGFGWADQQRQIAAGSRTIYRIGAISKSFTAVAMAQLAAEGRFDLDDPVVQYFPPLRQLAATESEINAISFRRLASHTAGLIREPNLPDAAAGPIAEWEDKVIASLPTVTLLGPPGEQYSYSNIGFGALGLATSRVARRPFMDLVRERIIGPLGMNNTMFIMTASLQPHLAVGYMVDDDSTVSIALPELEHAGRGYKVPNGGIYSNVADLARFASGVMGTSPTPLLPPQMREEMMRVQTPEDSANGYGLGFTIRTLENGMKTVGHGGSVAGYNATIVFDPETTLGVVMLRNYNRGLTNLGRAATDLLQELVAATTR
ncbi:MAG: serine hydrolase [Gemmatimonadetes bacterium]|nr:serine hydrolase [Gemmatimonadota bacterium]